MMILATGILLSVNTYAQRGDTVKHHSAKDLIELENQTNIIPTTRSNPPLVLQKANTTGKKAVKPKKAAKKFRKKKCGN